MTTDTSGDSLREREESPSGSSELSSWGNTDVQDGLGTLVESALAKVGLTSVVVEGWLGRECGCKERRDKLNSLSSWAKRVVSGRTHRAADFLRRIVRDW